MKDQQLRQQHEAQNELRSWLEQKAQEVTENANQHESYQEELILSQKKLKEAI